MKKLETTKIVETLNTKLKMVKTAFHKNEVRTGKKLVDDFENTSFRLDELAKKMANNEYLMRTGLSFKCDMVSNTLTNGSTKVSLKLIAIVPKGHKKVIQ